MGLASVMLLQIVMVSPGTHLVKNHESQSRTNESQFKKQRILHSLFSKKDAFQNTSFSCLKCSSSEKKLTHHVSKDFSSFNQQGNG